MTSASQVTLLDLRCVPCLDHEGNQAAMRQFSPDVPLAGRAGGQSGAVFAFMYPNFMVNRYGPWVDTNLVVPLDEKSCLVTFNWFISADKAGERQYIEAGLKASEEVQIEDIGLCEAVQRGLASPAYDVGR